MHCINNMNGIASGLIIASCVFYSCTSRTGEISPVHEQQTDSLSQDTIVQPEVKPVKFSYISKFHIIISCKLIVYIVMCFYQETNQEQKHELSYFLVFLFALPFFLFTCSYFEYFSKSFHTIFILSPRVIVAVIYG